MTSVTVIVPVYNEGGALGANLVLLADHLSLYSSSYDFDYIIVDDGSTDDSGKIARAFARHRRSVSVLSHDRNYGLGHALRTGIANAGGQYTIVVDADLSYTPAVAMELLEALDCEGADVALASAYMRGGKVVNVPFLRRVLSREANRLLSLAAKGRYATLTCMVRAYRTAFVKELQFRSEGMAANAELLLLAIRKRAAIIELPALLKWDDDRRTTHAFPSVRKAVRQAWSTAHLALSHRPALMLAMPGLIPGSWPLVVGILLLLHADAKAVAIGSVAILAVQYTSLAIFAGQLSAFFAHGFLRPRNAVRSKVFHL